MLYRILSGGIPVVIGLIGIGIVVKFDYDVQATSRDGVAATVQASGATFDEANLTFGSCLVQVPGRLFSVVSDQEEPPRPPTVAELMPQSMPGWQSRPMEEADFVQLTGMATVQPTGYELEAAEIQEELEGNLTFQIAMMQDMMNLINQGAGMTPFATVKGVNFTIAPVEGSDRAQRIMAQMGRQLNIEIITTGDTGHNHDMLRQLDIVGFNNLLAEPLAEVSVLSGVETDSAPKPVVHSGIGGKSSSSNCRIQDGIRRCVVGSN